MNEQLWNHVLDFDLDKPLSEYGFSTRLAHENDWPAGFTQEAILEYKKFMYLAATSKTMVSPSEIVDIVWHQHLIFTRSYDEFCKVLGKKIEHIPSTHNRQEAEKFRQAKSDTATLYRENFGPQPMKIWNCDTPYDSFELKPSRLSVKTLLLIWGALILLLATPAYWVLYGTYIRMSSDVFLPAFIVTGVTTIFLLEILNRTTITRFMRNLPDDHFLNKLTPEELIYMKTEKMEHVIHSTVNRMLHEGKLRVRVDRRLENVSRDYDCSNAFEHTVREYIGSGKRIYYNMLLRLSGEPVFRNTQLFVRKTNRYFTGTTMFIRLFIMNLVALTFPLLIGITRIATGLVRGKPVLFLIILMIVFTWMMISLLKKSTTTLTKVVVRQFYERTITALPFPERTIEWKYFLTGKYALSAALIPVIISANDLRPGISWSWEFDLSSSSGSSCGSSCGGGGSCGGGCGGGCGGCGS